MTKRKRNGLLSKLGPGLVSGAADDDPSGIATHCQVGAQFGYGLSWTFALSFPLLAVIQFVAAEIGSVTGRGIAQNLRRHYPRPFLWIAVSLLLIANVINLGADLTAMGAVVQMFAGGKIWLYTLIFGLICAGLEIFLPYRRYASVLKWTTLSLFAYVAVLIFAKVQWAEALESLVVPRIEWSTAYATGFVAIMGTTISPYLFFWQAAQEVEEERRTHSKPLMVTPRQAGPEIERIRDDTLIGMAFSTLVSVAIVFASAATLNRHGIDNVESAAQAAEALRPIAGSLAAALFAVGIIGTGMLAVPVLAGSAAYALSEMFGVTGSLSIKPTRARFFNGVILVTTLAGASLSGFGINPIRALYWSAVVNGILAVPLMALMMLIVRNPKAMGKLTLSRAPSALGWAATAVMALATVVFFASLL